MEPPVPSVGTEAEARSVNDDESIRLAQLQRIDDLKSRIGDHASWLQTTEPANGQYQKVENGRAPERVGNPHSPSSHNAVSKSIHSENAPATNGTVHKHNSLDEAMDMDTQPANGLSQEGLTAIRLESLNTASPQTNSSSNHTDDSAHSKAMDGVVSYASTNSSNSSAILQHPQVKIEQGASDNHPNGLHGDDIPMHSTPPAAKMVKPVASDSTSANLENTPTKRRRLSKDGKTQVTGFKARTAIPPGVSHQELARQSIEAALASRLNPFVLHPAEYQLLKDHMCHIHVTAYLNIRNRILRLWVRNPLVTVTAEEGAGCAMGTKWLGLAEVAYEWLVRNGYINFGCVEIPGAMANTRKRSKVARETVVVVGAGMSGLGCARQLEGLFAQYSEHWTAVGKEPPRVVLLEGRARIGGRIYSHPLHNQSSKRIPKHLRCTAEMGAHIITGFDHGNPLNMLIRGQLALHYYSLKDNSSLYDVDGRIVDLDHDRMVEKLFNDILDRASVYRHKHPTPRTVEGDRALVEGGKDPTGESGKTITAAEEEANALINQPLNLEDQGLSQVPGGIDKLTGKTLLVPGPKSKVPAAEAAEAMGWQLASPSLAGKDISLDSIANSVPYPTLGQAMDEAIKQYQMLLQLSPQDLRLLNWHYANLEYANAANVGKLSLGGWDQDIGNEFEGEHAQVIGGYIQLPRGILESPQPLDLRTKRIVDKIVYNADEEGEKHATVICNNGESIEASHVVLTIPLGVLKDHTIAFEPALPHWKADSIERLGFGILNKVILAYEKPFWDVDQDMIGLLRDTDQPDSESQDDYSANRGRFYLFWNCIKTVGRPLLIALMAGDAAVEAETRSDGEIVAEVQHQLCKMFRHRAIPPPQETIVTRWGQDPFARGTYSYVSPTAHSNDYDSMAKPVGNLHFAGEATCGTHPATVHGAYISGLRAASEVIASMLGPIEIPEPLIRATPPKPEAAARPDPIRPNKAPTSQSRADETLITGETQEAKQARLEAFEAEILKTIFAQIGPRPDKPAKMGANPFLLFSKDKWADCKARCDSARRAALNNPEAKASRNEIRAALGQMWREAPEDIKGPYLQQTVENKASNQGNAASFQQQLEEWDSKAIAIRKDYIQAHPDVLSKKEEADMWQALGVYAGQDRKAKKLSGLADEMNDVNDAAS